MRYDLNKLSERKLLAILIAITIVLLSAIPLARQILHEGIFVGEAAFHDLLSAENPKNLYQWLLSLTDNLPTVGLELVFILLGLASLLLFYSIVKEIEPEQRKRLFTMILLVSSPAFIYAFSTINTHAFSIFLLLISTKLLIKKQKPHLTYIAFGLLLVVATLTVFNALLVLLILFLYFSTNKSKASLTALLSSFFISLVYYLLFNPEKIVISVANPSRQFLSSMGAANGYSLLFLLLAIIGFLAMWKKRSIIYLALIYLLASYPFFKNTANSYFVFALAIFAGEGLSQLTRRKWQVSLIKNLSIALIIIGIMFSTSTYLSRLANAEPNEEMVKGLEALKGLPYGLVVSHCSNGYWINYFSGQKAFISDCYEKQKIETANKIFYSIDIAKAKSMLQQNNISYIWIDAEMKQGQVWSTPQQELLFLFRNNKTFKNIYKDSVEAWQVLG